LLFQYPPLKVRPNKALNNQTIVNHCMDLHSYLGFYTMFTRLRYDNYVDYQVIDFTKDYHFYFSLNEFASVLIVVFLGIISDNLICNQCYWI
jgi:hypothetical protein